MKRIRKPNEDLEEMLKELKIGDNSVYDESTNYEITKVPNGFIYKNEYVGMVFVPDFPQEEKVQQVEPTVSVEGIQNSVTKASPKRAVIKTKTV